MVRGQEASVGVSDLRDGCDRLFSPLLVQACEFRLLRPSYIPETPVYYASYTCLLSTDLPTHGFHDQRLSGQPGTLITPPAPLRSS